MDRHSLPPTPTQAMRSTNNNNRMNNINKMNSNINESSLGVSIFLITASIVFSVYTSTASHSIAGGDSGELVAEGCQLGTSHPPGYPLYTVIVYLVTSFGKQYYPTLSPAYMVNITSCLFGSISSGLISLIVYKLTNGIDDGSDKVGNTKEGLSISPQVVAKCSVALSTGLLSAFSPLMWQYNTSAEVFALHNLFVTLIVYVLVIYNSKPNSTWIIALGSFLCGLAMTNQHTSILLILPVGVHVFYKSSILNKPKLLFISTLSFLAGISLYALLPYFAITNPHAGSWGDVTSLSGFIHHFLRRDYGTMRLFSGDDSVSEGMLARTWWWLYDFAICQCPLGMLFVLFSFLVCCIDLERFVQQMEVMERHIETTEKGKSTSSTLKVLHVALIFYLVVFHSLSNLPLSNPLLFGIHQRFWMHPNILMFIIVGVRIHEFISVMPRRSSIKLLALSVVILLLPFATYQRNYSARDQSSNNYFRKYALSILEPLPSNSLLLINYDQQWTSIRYLQECEGVRTDITSINLSMMTFGWWQSKLDLYENVSFPGTHYTRDNTLPWQNGAFTFSELIDANTEHFGSDIFIGGRLNFDDPEYHASYHEIPFGLVRQIRSQEHIDISVETAKSYRSFSLQPWTTIANHLSADLPSEEKYPQTEWEWTIRREFFDHMVSRSTHLLNLALNENESSPSTNVLPSIVESALWLELASSWDKDTYAESSSMRKNLGLAYMNMVRSKESTSFPIIDDIFDYNLSNETNWWSSESNEYNDWKEWASTRWRYEWEAFLGLESSKSEPGYHQIKQIYDSVMGSLPGR